MCSYNFVSNRFCFSQGRPWGSTIQAVIVDGTLQLLKGQIALVSGDTGYYIHMLERYIGFIDEIKEENRVSVEGHVYGNVLQPTKMTVDGKLYELTAIIQPIITVVVATTVMENMVDLCVFHDDVNSQK